MGSFKYFTVLVLAAVYQCEGDTYFNSHKTLNPKYVKSNWMKCIPNEKPISSVSIPGTHQSLKSGGLNDYKNFQAWELLNQLHAGVRFVDMTLWISLGKLYVENNAVIYYEKFSHVLSQLQIFLKVKKSETVLLRLAGNSKSISRAKEELNRVADVEVWKNRNIPTMGEARRKIVLIQGPGFDWGLPVNAMVLGKDKKNKEFQMRANIKKASEYCTNEMMLTDTGAKGTWEIPRKVAKKLNNQLGEHLMSLYNENKIPSCLGIIAVDFPGPKLIELMITISCSSGSGSGRSSDTGLNGPHQSGPMPGTPPKSEQPPSPATSPKPEPVITRGTSPKPEPVTTPGTSPKPEPVTTPGTSPKPEPVSIPATSPKSEPITAPATSPNPEPVTTPGTTPKPEPVTTPGTTPKPEPVTTPGTSPKPEPVTTPGTSPNPEPVTTPGTSPNPEPVTTPGTSPKPEPITAPATSPNPEPVRTPGTSSKPEPVTTPATSPKPEPVQTRKKKCHPVHRRKHSPLVS